jgi:hypothetical protein
MIDTMKQLKTASNVVAVEKNELEILLKDRLDFGFDSLYFRYAELCDELAAYKAQLHHSDPVKERDYMNGRKMHFYDALEQLVHAHEKGDNE